MKVKILAVTLLTILMVAACGPTPVQPESGDNNPSSPLAGPQPAAPQETNPPPEANPPAAPFPTSTPDINPDSNPNPTTEQTTFGPNLEDFPSGYNPMTGLPVANPSLLDFPAVLISYSHFPASSRPLSGLSFSPFVMEMYITEGMTRFLAAFYGGFPATYGSLAGGCEPNTGILSTRENLIGDWVWLDSNQNGQQDAGELGISGVCVSLYDAGDQSLLETTATDSNGFYGFAVEPDKSYLIQFAAPDGMTFTGRQAVNRPAKDSDADPATGQTAPFSLADGIAKNLDAGLVLDDPSQFNVDPLTWMPAGETAAKVDTLIGPIRSGRLPYAYVRDFFQNSCLVYAGSAAELSSTLKGCAMAFGNDDGGAGSMMDVTRLKKIAEQNTTGNEQFNYSGNLFDAAAPAGGTSVTDLRVFYSFLNQSKWFYDPLMESWQRYVDKADGSGNFYPDTDRLTGRQLHFENVIVLVADHEAITSTIIDINLRIGETGDAYLFRDGQMYKIKWTTVADEYEKTTGLRRPLRFTDEAGNPFPLKPGSTWVHIITHASYLQEESPSHWLMRFYAPAGSK